MYGWMKKMMILSSSRHLYIAHYAKKAIFFQKIFFEQKLPFCNSVHCVCNVTHNEGLE